MKKYLKIFISFALFSDQLLAQQEKQQEKKNIIHFEFYQPIRTSSMGGFYNEDWDFLIRTTTPPPTTEFSRNYFSGAFGISYERMLKNNIIINPHIGITLRKLKEHFVADYHNQPIGGYDNITVEDFNYKQKHINLSLRLAKRFFIFQKFSMNIGVNFAYILYLDGISKSYIHTDQYNTISAPSNPTIIETHDIWVTTKPGILHMFGLGPKMNIEYNFFRNRLIASVGLQTFYTYLTINDVNTFSYKRISNYLTLTLTEEILYEEKEQKNIKQFGWSNISPLVSIGYKF